MNSFCIFFLLQSCVYAMEFSSRARNFSHKILLNTQFETDGHVVISPFGIWSLMTALALGTEANSRDQLVEALGLPSSQLSIVDEYQSLSNAVLSTESEDVNLTSNNFMFIDQMFQIKTDFKEMVETDFNTKEISLDFASPSAAGIANDAIKNTGSTLSDVFSPDVFSKSKFILTNVINFKGVWKLPFNESDTNIEPFYDENNNKIGEAKMMYKTDSVPFSVMESLQSLVMELPYGNDGKFCMLLILPDSKVKVTDVFRNLRQDSIETIFDKLKKNIDEYGIGEVEIKLPRFKSSTNIVLNEPLMDMGVYDIFTDGLANFELITDSKVYVSEITHNANIEVTEAGTTASAVTSAQLADRFATPEFKANRPFIYFVMEKPTATIVFGGIYSKPTVF